MYKLNKQSVIAALLATVAAEGAALGAACDTVTTPDNGGCSAELRCATAPAAVLNTCVAQADCGVENAGVTTTCYETPAPAAPVPTPYVPCSDDMTKREDIILTAMTNHHNTALAKKTADVTTYETDLNAKILAITTAKDAVDAAKKAGTEAAKAAGTDVMPAAESTAVTDAEAALATLEQDLVDWKVGKEAHQAILDEIAQSQLALDHATENAAYAMHRCITPEQQAHYDKKIAAEKVMWGYDKMTDADKKIFNDYITQWTAFHQENDAKVKEETGYYNMPDAEKQIFDKLHIQMKEKEDYYDDKFDAQVKRDMASAKFQALTDEEKKAFLNKKRDEDFAEMRKLVQSGDIDMISRKAMDFFGIPEEKRSLVNNVISKWQDTRKQAESGIQGQMRQMLSDNAEKFENMSASEKLAFMNKVKSMGEGKMGDFLTGMMSDERKRVNDGYFDMSDDERDKYDSVRDKFREFFGTNDFISRRGDGRRGDRSDRDYDDDSDDIDSVVDKIKDMLGGNGSILEKLMSGGIGGGNIRDTIQKLMGGGGDSDDDWEDEKSWSGNTGGEWSSCSAGGRGGRGGDQCGRGMCCASVRGKSGNFCVNYQSRDVQFSCLEQAQKLVASFAAVMTLYSLI